MDTTVSLPNITTKKLLIGRTVGEGEDFISKLPDNILLHIFSFLSIKDVLRTSVLSTRWKYLWTSVSEIDFDETRYNLGSGTESFLDSVERILLLHDPSCIRRFRLRLNMSVNTFRVNSWISTVINHKVEELDISLPATTPVLLPNSLFTSDTLSVLRLKMGLFCRGPRFINFSNLRSLNLKGVIFRGDKSSELFAGCPVLDKLILYNCTWKETKRITISIPSLRTLTIYHPRCLDYLCDSLLAIYAQNLISLSCTRCLAIGILPCTLSSLNDVYIDEPTFRCLKKEFAQRAIELIYGIRNVRSLILTNDTLQCLSFGENLHACPIFHRLTHLKIIPGVIDCSDDQVSMYILQNSPNLESLEIPKVFLQNNGWFFEIVPECFTSCLRTVSISYFEGKVEEVPFLKYLFENASMLERVRIFCPVDLASDMEKQKEISHQLQAINSCEIEFCKRRSNR